MQDIHVILTRYQAMARAQEKAMITAHTITVTVFGTLMITTTFATFVLLSRSARHSAQADALGYYVGTRQRNLANRYENWAIGIGLTNYLWWLPLAVAITKASG